MHDNHFFAFEIKNRINTTTNPTRKNAHHIPALNIVSTAPQLLSSIRFVNKKNSIRFAFITPDLIYVHIYKSNLYAKLRGKGVKRKKGLTILIKEMLF